MKFFLFVALLFAGASANSLFGNFRRQESFISDHRSWLPEDATVLEPSDSESAPSESSAVPATSASETVAPETATANKSQSSSLSDVLSGKSPLAAVNGEKPEAFLIHFKPKSGQTSKSKYMLLLKLPDGSTETIEANSETLASDASQDAKSVPSVEESARNLQQTTQNQFDDELGFDDEPQSQTGSAAAAAGASTGRYGSSSAAAAAAGGSSASAAVSSGGRALAAIEQQIQQADDEQQQQEAERPQQRPNVQDTQQQVSDDDTQQQALDDEINQQVEQQRLEQDRDGGSSASADPAAGYGQQNPLSGLTASPHSGAVYTSYAGTPDQQVPVILIALPPRASAQSQKLTLDRLLSALRSPSSAPALTATKGYPPLRSAPGARKGASLRGKTSHASPAAQAIKGIRPADRPIQQAPLPGGTKGGSVSGSLRILGPLSPVAQLTAKGGSAAGLRGKGTRGQGNTNSPENPQSHQPTGGFGGYGNSHTPSPSGGYGSVAMRLAAKGIPAPTERDVQRPATLKAILSLARQPSAAGSQGRKAAQVSVRNYA